MAMALNAGEVGRQDLFSISPENIIVTQGENGRAIPHSPDEIASLAQSILDHGQQQPVIIRRVENHKVKLVAGYGRYRAVCHINTVLRPENPVKLQCKVVDCNPEEAFVRNLVENIERADTTPIDDAHAQRRLREEFGWKEERIATFYKRSVAYLCQLRKTLQLSTPIQAEIAAGNLPISTAIDLVELPEAERATALTEATQDNGKVNGEVIKKKVRQQKIDNGEGGKGRSLKELRSFFEGKTGPGEKEAVKGLADKVLAFIGGKLTDKQMENALEKFCKENDNE